MNRLINSKQWTSPILVFLLATLTACSGSDEKDPNSTLGNIVYDGVWEQLGHGLYVDIDSDTVTRYEASSGSCIKTHSLPRSGFPENFNWTITDFNYDSFEVYSYENEADTSILTKVSGLPTSCTTPVSNTPSNVINHLFSMADDHYAFLDERNIDLHALKAEALFNDDMSQQELKEIITDVLSEFNDAHVMLYSDEINPLEPEFNLEHLDAFDLPMNIIYRMYNDYLALAPPISADDYITGQLELYFLILDSYMDAPLVTKGGADNDKVQWATINQNIGYIQIRDLGGFGPNNTGNSISEAQNPQSDLNAFNNVMDEVVEDLQHTSGIILDLRHHTGGTTELDRALASRFFESETTYGSISVPGTSSVTLTISPYNGARLSQPIVVISSGLNSSSAEDLIMALKADSDTIQIGERTHGTLSNQLYLSLPNQWAFTLSNETWLDADGASWEVQGIQPADEFDVYPSSDRQNGINTAIEKALALLQ